MIPAHAVSHAVWDDIHGKMAMHSDGVWDKSMKRMVISVEG